MPTLEYAANLGANINRRPVDQVAVTGSRMFTTFGNTERSWQALLDGRSGVIKFPVNNFRTNIAAPINWFDPKDYFDKQELARLKDYPKVTLMGVALGREVANQANLVDSSGKLYPQYSRHLFGSWVGSGYAANQDIIDARDQIHQFGEEPEDLRRGSVKYGSKTMLRFMFEGFNATIRDFHGFDGTSGSIPEACATGITNQVLAYEQIKSGLLTGALTGGFDDLLSSHSEVAIGTFAKTSALSDQNDEPETASRPFDAKRSGFVIGSGGGILLYEDAEHARERGAAIQAIVAGASKNSGGISITEYDPQRVAAAMLEASFDPKSRTFKVPDVYVAHGTGTVKGDKNDLDALKLAFPEDYPKILITGNKGNFGHPAGGAGAVNSVEAMLILDRNIVPHVANLTDPEYGDEFNFVMGRPREAQVDRVLTMATGFFNNHGAISFERNQK